MSSSILPNYSFPPNIDPQTYSLIDVFIGSVLVGDLNANEQNSLGKSKQE